MSLSLTLASRSPQRRAILEQLGIAFEIRFLEIEELEDGPPGEIALQNAQRKALAVASEDSLTLGVDTIVALDGRIYGKPADDQAAHATLQALSGRRHQVMSGICLLGPDLARGRERAALVTTTVEFRPLSEPMIDWYVATGEWRDRAGGYAIQGRGAALVRRIEGDYLNVVGLPIAELLELEPALLPQ